MTSAEGFNGTGSTGLESELSAQGAEQLQLSEGTLELDLREENGLSVALLWNQNSDEVFVKVEDTRSGERFSLLAARDNALEVFRHPYAYRTLGPLALEAA